MYFPLWGRFIVFGGIIARITLIDFIRMLYTDVCQQAHGPAKVQFSGCILLNSKLSCCWVEIFAGSKSEVSLAVSIWRTMLSYIEDNVLKSI